MAFGKLRLLQWIAIAGLIGGTTDALSAATLTYTWSGSLRPHDAAAPDPWGLGVAGVPFTMSTTVDAAAADDNPIQSPFADFAAVHSRLWVDGEEVTFVGGARIDFSDTTIAAAGDTIVMGGTFSKGGHTVSIFSVVGVSPHTFSFDFPSETPPLFAATPVIGLSEDLSEPYIASVPAGTLVSVVPEPHAFLSGLFGTALLVRRRLRNE